ncbi:MAG: pyridoxamine 5'-phosphate oxidase [Verrucomicrobiota bacterium]
MNREETDIAALRENYTRGELRKEDLLAEPIEQFRGWLEEAVEGKLLEPNAMTLATVGGGGVPSVRTVLLKGLDERGFRFFTNYRSKKALDLEESEWAAVSFLWRELERQVNVKGVVRKISREESEEYFRTRPYESKIGAWVSEVQSGVIAGREVLEERMEKLQEEYGEEVPMPEFWGGYVLEPSEVEFWQGGAGRVHDRLVYRKEESGWEVMRLSP